jgi:hypothetical protein
MFPPRWFNLMQYLLVHLSYEAKVGDPQQYRRMYHIDRVLKNLRVMVRNKARVEGCIVEQFKLKEIAYFISVYFEGPEKVTRGGGGGEWEPIKIPQVNLSYIPKSIRCPSLLTRSRSHSYRKAIGPQNRVRKPRNIAEDNNQCKQTHV